MNQENYKNINLDDELLDEEDTSGKSWKQNIEKYFDIALTSFVVIAACILFYFILFKFNNVSKIFKVILSVMSPIIVGFAFAYVLNPLVMLLDKYLLKFYEYVKEQNAKRVAKKSTAGKSKNSHKERESKKKAVEKSDDNAECTNQNEALVGPAKTIRRLSVFISVVAAVTVIILLMSAVIPAFTESLSNLVDKFPEYYQTISDKVVSFVDSHEWIKKQIPDANKVLEEFNIMQIASDYLNSLLSAAYNWVVVIMKVVYNVVIGLIVAIYLLGGKERYLGQVKKLTFSVMKPKTAKKVVQVFHGANQIFKSAILGKILDSIIIGFICFIGMSILGMFGCEAIADNRILVSVIVGVTNVIPFFGPYIGGIPSVVLILCVKPVDGLIFAIFIIALQQFDCNYLDPRIVGRSVGLSPLYVLVFCLIGGGLFGIVGMLIGSPTGAVIYGLAKSWTESRLEQKNLPTQTIDYVNTPGAIIYGNSVNKDEKNN
jgi:predicted PurR-regulated permease PerM